MLNEYLETLSSSTGIGLDSLKAGVMLFGESKSLESLAVSTSQSLWIWSKTGSSSSSSSWTSSGSISQVSTVSDPRLKGPSIYFV
jgi:hypothetical protein